MNEDEFNMDRANPRKCDVMETDMKDEIYFYETRSNPNIYTKSDHTQDYIQTQIRHIFTDQQNHIYTKDHIHYLPHLDKSPLSTFSNFHILISKYIRN